MTAPNEQERLLTPAEVAQLFRVDPKTVSRWAAEGKLRCIRTLGGHRRFMMEDVQRLLGEAAQDSQTPREETNVHADVGTAAESTDAIQWLKSYDARPTLKP